jgi:hypothetical protein
MAKQSCKRMFYQNIRPGVKASERMLSKGEVGRSALRSRAEKDKKFAKAIFFQSQHQHENP